MEKTNLIKKILITTLALVTLNVVNVFAGQTPTTKTKEPEYSMTFCSNGTKSTVPMDAKYFEITSGGAYNEAVYANLREANKTKYFNVNPGIAPGAMGCLVETLMPNDAFTGTVEDGVLRILSKEMTNRNMRDITDAIITYNCTDEVGERCGTTGSTYYAKQVANVVSKEIYPSMELIEYTTMCGAESVSYQIPNINTIAASGKNFKRLANGNYEITHSGGKKLVLNKNVVELTLEGLITLNKEKNDKCSNSSADYGDLTVKILNSKYVNGDKDVEFEVAIFGLPYLNINNDIKDVVFYKTFDDAENKTSNKLTSSYVGTKDNKRIYKVTVPGAARKDIDGCNPATIAVRIVHNSTQSGKYTVSYINTGTSRLYRDILAQELLTGETTQITEKSQCTNTEYMINEDEEYGFECFYKGSSKINQYALGIIDREEFRADCCGYDKDRILSDKMTKSNYSLYELACKACFGTGDTMQAKYRENPKEYHLEYSGCCTENNAKEQMGAEEYETVCNNCFSGKYSLRTKYNQNPGIAQEQYKKCCSESNAKEQMGEIVYNRLCMTGQAKEASKEMVCDTGSNDSYIYEVEEKSIISENYEKLMVSKDINNKPYEDGRFALNPYCSVYCKEDVDLYFQGLGWNEKTEHRIQSGQYFRFKDYEGQGLLLKNLPTLKQERSCLYKADTESYTLDMYGKSYKWSEIDKISPENITGGYYYFAKRTLEMYYKIQKYIETLKILAELQKTTSCYNTATGSNIDSNSKVSQLNTNYIVYNTIIDRHTLGKDKYLANKEEKKNDNDIIPAVLIENTKFYSNFENAKIAYDLRTVGSLPIKGTEYIKGFDKYTQFRHVPFWPEQKCCPDFRTKYNLSEVLSDFSTWRTGDKMIKYIDVKTHTTIDEKGLAEELMETQKENANRIATTASAYLEGLRNIDVDLKNNILITNNTLAKEELYDTEKAFLHGLSSYFSSLENPPEYLANFGDAVVDLPFDKLLKKLKDIKEGQSKVGIQSTLLRVCAVDGSDSDNYKDWEAPTPIEFNQINGEEPIADKPTSGAKNGVKPSVLGKNAKKPFFTIEEVKKQAINIFGEGIDSEEGIIYEFDKIKLLANIESYDHVYPANTNQKDTGEIDPKTDKKIYKTELSCDKENIAGQNPVIDSITSSCTVKLYTMTIEHYKRESKCPDKKGPTGPTGPTDPTDPTDPTTPDCTTNPTLPECNPPFADCTTNPTLPECQTDYTPDLSKICRETTANNIRLLNYLINLMENILVTLENVYSTTMQHMVTATANYSDCMNYENAYQTTDYPSVTDFYYDEMKLADQQTKEILKELKLTEQENERIVNLAAKPGSKEFDFCEGEPNKLICATDDKNKRRTLPIFINSLNNTDKYESMSSYLTSQSANTSEMIFYDYGKNATDVRVSYNVGIDMYVIKPSGLTVTKNSPMLTDDILKHGRYQMLGFGLPVGLRTRASIYDYRFTVANLGKTNRMLAYYNKVEQVDNGLHECNYYVGNNVMCPTTEGCFNCEPGDVGCWSNLAQGQMEDPRLMAQPRRVPGADINPTGRELGQNLTTAEAQAAIAHMKEQGGELTSDNLMYSFTLNKETQKAIKSDTKVNGYSNFNLDCDGLGQKCLSPFIDEEFGFDRQASKMRASYYEYDKETDSIVTNSERAEKQPIR